MIPKKHYCWFGGRPLPKLAKKCINSWRKFCPDYEINQWDENNFNIASSPLYVRQAYQSHKYAFVSDYVRLWAMVNFGGIYMDTDVEVVQPLDGFLHCDAFSGFEDDTQIPTGIMAGCMNFPLFVELLEEYDELAFINDDGSLDMTTNVTRITRNCLKHGFVPNGKYQVIEGFSLYPKEYFCPLNNSTGVLSKTPNTTTIHWFNKSWLSTSQRLRSAITKPFHNLFGENCFIWLKKMLKCDS